MNTQTHKTNPKHVNHKTHKRKQHKTNRQNHNKKTKPTRQSYIKHINTSTHTLTHETKTQNKRK